MTQKKFFGHPPQLSNLFHIELWERFSFYGMQAILMIYLYYAVDKGGLGIDESLAGAVVGAYSGSVYLATVGGGWLADRVLGSERTLFWSGVVVMAGHIVLALLPGVAGLVGGLILIGAGSGGVKASAGTMVGSLYESEDTRPLRDAGFSIFYIAINIGALLGPLLTGWLQVNYSFHHGFGAAAVGMAFGLWQYGRGRGRLPKSEVPNPLPAGRRNLVLGLVLAAVVAVLLLVRADVLNVKNFSSALSILVLTISLLYFAFLLANRKVSAGEKRHIAAYIPLFAALCVFWALWYQVYTSVTVYFDKTVLRQVVAPEWLRGWAPLTALGVDPASGRFEIPVGWLASLQAMWVIALSGVMAALWSKMGRFQPKAPVKFSLALLGVGASYLCFVPYVHSGVPLPLMLFSLVILAITVSELLISPISMSLITKIAPAHFKTQMVALNYLAFSLGFTLGGKLFHTYYEALGQERFYMMLGTIGLAAGAVMLLCSPFLNRMMNQLD